MPAAKINIKGLDTCKMIIGIVEMVATMEPIVGMKLNTNVSKNMNAMSIPNRYRVSPTVTPVMRLVKTFVDRYLLT